MRIVLVEDNELLARGISGALRDLGHAVDWLGDGRDGESFLASEGADVAIVDVNLPGENGFDLVRSLRKRGLEMPVLLLTARGDLRDRVTGLNAGADDYLIKPFEMAELIARLHALARRAPHLKPMVEAVGSLRFDRATRQLLGSEGAIELTRRELALFECLLDQAGRIVAKESIAETVYGIGSEIEPNAVELVVSRLRRKLGGHGVGVRTARGLGYMLEVQGSGAA